jgi:hypothetical protein
MLSRILDNQWIATVVQSDKLTFKSSLKGNASEGFGKNKDFSKRSGG